MASDSRAAVVHCLLDFKSSGSLLLFRGPLQTLERDYAAELHILPFEAAKSDLDFVPTSAASAQARERSRDDLVRAHKLHTFRCYASLQGLSYGDFSGSSHMLLLALSWMREQSCAREAVWRYCSSAFDAFHDPAVDHESADVAWGLMLASCAGSAPVPGSRAAFQAFCAAFPYEPVRSVEPVAHAEREVFGVPCLVAPNGVMAYQPLALGIIRWQLHQAGLARGPGVTPDVPVAWRSPEPAVSARARGMPGTGGPSLLARYRANSRDAAHARGAGATVDVFVDVKSPHAWLALEMTMALEEDFDVRVNWRPFDLALAAVYGDAKADVRKRHAKSRVPPPVSFASAAQQRTPDRPAQQRTPAQRNIVKWTYADLRRYANIRGLTLFGTERVWDSTLVLKAMLFVKASAAPLREPLDRFLETAFERLWRRDLDLHSLPALAAVVRGSGVDPAGLEAFCAPGNEGDVALGGELQDALRAGVFGVPSYALDGEMFWGKEHLSLIRLRLRDKGLALRGDDGGEPPIDVPYLWRPDWPAQSQM